MMPTSPLRLAALISLATLGFGAVVGLIAVLDADEVRSAVGIGVGIAAVVFIAGATIACGLACLSRGKLELPAFAAVTVAGLAIDLLVLAVWLEIDSEAYGKVAGVAFVWTFFGLIALGLTLAVDAPAELARALYVAALVTIGAAALISTWLVATAGSVLGNRSTRSETTACCARSAPRSSCSPPSGSAPSRPAGWSAARTRA